MLRAYATPYSSTMHFTNLLRRLSMRLSLSTTPVFTFACALTGLFVSASGARAQYIYQLDQGPAFNGTLYAINNSATTETEDNFVANSFVVVPGAEKLTSITFYAGVGLANLPANETITAAIYTGSSLTNPQAGGGLARILAATTTVLMPRTDTTYVTIPLAAPVMLTAGQIFYASLLLRGVPGSSFPLART